MKAVKGYEVVCQRIPVLLHPASVAPNVQAFIV